MKVTRTRTNRQMEQWFGYVNHYSSCCFTCSEEEVREGEVRCPGGGGRDGGGGREEGAERGEGV